MNRQVQDVTKATVDHIITCYTQHSLNVKLMSKLEVNRLQQQQKTITEKRKTQFSQENRTRTEWKTLPSQVNFDFRCNIQHYRMDPPCLM